LERSISLKRVREGYFASASSTQLMKWAIWIRDGAQKRQNRMALRGPRCADIDVVDLRSARRLNQHLAPSSAAFAIADRIISTGNRPRLWLPWIIHSNTDAFHRSTVALCWHPLKREPCAKQGLFRLQHSTINTHIQAPTDNGRTRVIHPFLSDISSLMVWGPRATA
jgi:hypothetical protein